MSKPALDLVVFASLILSIQGSCESLFRTPVPSVCYGVLDYDVYVPSGQCNVTLEQSVDTAPTLWGALSETCRPYAAKLMCTSTYYKCTETTAVAPCRSLCDEVTSSCTAAEQALLTTFGVTLTCAGYPTTNCAAGPTTTPDVAAIQVPKCTESYNGDTCRGVVNYPVYLAPFYTLDVLESAAADFHWAFNIAPPETGCNINFPKYVCGQAFLACSVQEFSGFNFTLPQFPCKSVCDAYEATCSILTAAIPVNCNSTGTAPDQEYDCAGTVTQTGQRDFPKVSTTFAGGALSTTCNKYDSTTAEVASVNYACPSPLVVPDDPSDRIAGTSCAAPCPTLLWTSDDYSKADALLLAVSIIGFIAVTFTWLSFVCFKKKRKMLYVIYFITCELGVSFFVMCYVLNASSLDHIAEYGCQNNASDKSASEDGWCSFTSLMIVLLTEIAVSWWCVVSFDLFLKVVCEIRNLQKHKFVTRGYYIFALGIPLFFTVLTASLGVVGNGDLGVGYCFIHGRNEDYPYAAWYTFYFPLATFAIFGMITMVATIVKLFISSRRTGSTKKPGWWKAYVRPLVFVFSFLIIFLFVFLYRVIAFFREDTWNDSAEEFVSCLLQGQYAPPYPDCGDAPAERPNFTGFMLIQFAATGQSLTAFAIYGFTWENVHLWANYFGHCCGIDACIEFGEGSGGSSRASRTGDSSSNRRTQKSKGAYAQSFRSTKGKTSKTGNNGNNNNNNTLSSKAAATSKERKKHRKTSIKLDDDSIDIQMDDMKSVSHSGSIINIDK